MPEIKQFVECDSCSKEAVAAFCQNCLDDLKKEKFDEGHQEGFDEGKAEAEQEAADKE